MNTLTEHLMLEHDVETPTVEVPALDTHVVEDGDVMAAEYERAYPADCYCTDGRHREIDRERVEYPDSRARDHAHRITVHLYAVIEESVMTPDDMANSDLRSASAIDAETAKDAELARRAVARQYPDDVETGKATWKQLGIEKGGKR